MDKDSGNNNRSKKSGRRSGQDRPPNKDKFEWKKATKTLSFWILIVVGSIVISQLYSNQGEREAEIAYTDYVQMLEAGEVESGTIVENVFHGTLRPDAARSFPNGGKTFRTVLPYLDESMLKKWDEYGLAYSFKEKTTNWVGYLLSSILPWILLIGIWLLIMRRMQGGGTRGIFSFGKSRAKLLTENRPKLTFDDVAGADEAKEELQEIIEFLKDPKRFQKLGGRIPRGALLLGPPGTGKTLLAKAVAGEAGVPFFSMSGADFVEMFVGVGASRVRDLFEQGKKSAPCIIFIDEIDAVGRQRGAGLGGGHDEREQTLNQLLVEMDGFDSNEGVILVAATNRPDILDPALLRPGRFDRQIVVDRPDVRGRAGIFKVHTKKIPLDRDVNLEVLAKGTPGLAGADIENIVNEAALLAAKRNANTVKMSDFEGAKDKVMMGVERRSMIISDREKKNTAFHEAGHVLVAKLIPESDPVHKVTIIPRGRALGLTHFIPIDEKHNYSQKYLDNTLAHLLGGRVAEKLVLDELTTGAGNDIERATEIARKMVCEWGMSEKMGPLSFGKKDEEIFLGREIAKHRDYSEGTAVDIDNEVRRIVMNAEKRATDLVKANLNKLHNLANALLEREILDGFEIDRILDGKKLHPRKKPSSKRHRSSKSGKSGESSPQQVNRTAPSKTAGDKKPQAETSGKPEQNKNAAQRRSASFKITNDRSTADEKKTEKETPVPAKPPEPIVKNTDPKTSSRIRRSSRYKKTNKIEKEISADTKSEFIEKKEVYVEQKTFFEVKPPENRPIQNKLVDNSNDENENAVKDKPDNKKVNRSSRRYPRNVRMRITPEKNAEKNEKPAGESSHRDSEKNI